MTPDLFAEHRAGPDRRLCDYPQGEIPPAPQPDEINYTQRLMEYARAVRFRGDW